ncbi:hypothetical protein [Frankia sp. ACN1ag]|uniref:hypothetical protein n=1 Tax=Frankia sp. ACN1ag TaxID=102891 RepID=UPI0006DCF7C7|nr:hypothetical protein [Frankia sp. ACN1ag]KQC39864.1 hypothetical protein UK82_01660 [Frankia sp. ACN1ag]
MQPGHADVADQLGLVAVGAEPGGDLAGDRQVRGAGRQHRHEAGPGRCGPPGEQDVPRPGAGGRPAGVGGERRASLVGLGPGQQDRAGTRAGQQPAHRLGALCW